MYENVDPYDETIWRVKSKDIKAFILNCSCDSQRREEVLELSSFLCDGCDDKVYLEKILVDRKSIPLKDF